MFSMDHSSQFTVHRALLVSARHTTAGPEVTFAVGAFTQCSHKHAAESQAFAGVPLPAPAPSRTARISAKGKASSCLSPPGFDLPSVRTVAELVVQTSPRRQRADVAT